jgi:hypothetical protein
MFSRRFTGAIALAIALAGTALAQEPTLAEQLLDRFGQTVERTADPILFQTLYGRGLITKDTHSVKLDRELIEKVVGNQAYFNEVRKIRYHVGDRIFVKDASDELSIRAEIAKVNPDGTYSVKVWDRPSSETTTAVVNGVVDPVTGLPPAGSSPAVLDVLQPDGSLRSVIDRAPWLTHWNERKVVLTHEQVDELNGYVDPAHGGSYLVNGFVSDSYTTNGDVVDLTKDATLRERVVAANGLADVMIKSGELDLSLPADKSARPAALERIAAAQRKLVDAIFEANRMEYGNPDSPPAFMIGGRRMVGRYLAAAMGKCTGQAMALGAILREVGRRMGFDVRQIRASGHSFFVLVTGDMKRYLIDPAGNALHVKNDVWPLWLRFANLDFTTDRGPYADHYFNHLSYFADEGVTPKDKTTFQSTPQRTDLARGASTEFLRRLDAKPTTGADRAVQRATRSGGMTATLERRVHDAHSVDRAEER